MNNKTAIAILKRQINKLQSSKENRNDSWTIETKHYIISFFGENSIQKDFFNGYSWSLNPNSDLDWQENQVVLFLNDCINIIKNVGLYKKPKTNIVSDKSNFELISIVIAISLFAFWIGYWAKNIELFSIENKKEVSKSLSSYGTSQKISNPEKKHTESSKTKIIHNS
jgi:hypothetical protein